MNWAATESQGAGESVHVGRVEMSTDLSCRVAAVSGPYSSDRIDPSTG